MGITLDYVGVHGLCQNIRLHLHTTQARFKCVRDELTRIIRKLVKQQ